MSRLEEIYEAWLETQRYIIRDDDSPVQEQIKLIESFLARAKTPLTMHADDGIFNPALDRVYWYAHYHSDGCPTYGCLNFDVEKQDFILPHGCNTIFIQRANVDRFIAAQMKKTPNTK